MPSPPIQVFLTTIASQPALRQRQEYILRILQVKNIQFTSYDLASNEDARRLWKRKAPLSKQQLPGILVGGSFPGAYDDFEEAVEYGELDTFLRLKESWTSDPDDIPMLSAKPIGVPGASSPSQMTNHKPSYASPAPSPLKDKSKKGGELDAGAILDDVSLQGVSVTDADLEELLSELGLEGDDVGELVKGLSTAIKEPESTLSEGNVGDDVGEKAEVPFDLNTPEMTGKKTGEEKADEAPVIGPATVDEVKGASKEGE